jgi:hypothetical protein
MRLINRITLKKNVCCSLVILLLGLSVQSFGQDVKYDPKGDPGKWNFNITPFLILPWVSGNVQSEMLSGEFGIDPADFLSSLNGTFMIDAEISRGKLYASPSYIYNYNSVDKILWTSGNGNQTIAAQPNFQKHILEVIAGMRLRLGARFMLDPFAGFRYTHYRLFGEVEGIKNTSEINESADFWDPIFGFQAHYYPHPRVPVELKVDCGGFGVGSKFTWSAWFNSGYAVSRVVDIIAGFAALSNNYEAKTGSGRSYGMTSITYGVTVGARFYLPGRAKDPGVFKKFVKY